MSGLSLGGLVSEETTYGAWVKDTEGTEHLVETFQTLPAFAQMRQLLSDVLNGKVTSLASYTRDADGNSTLSLNSGTLDEGTSEADPSEE